VRVGTSVSPLLDGRWCNCGVKQSASDWPPSKFRAVCANAATARESSIGHRFSATAGSGASDRGPATVRNLDRLPLSAHREGDPGALLSTALRRSDHVGTGSQAGDGADRSSRCRRRTRGVTCAPRPAKRNKRSRAGVHQQGAAIWIVQTISCSSSCRQRYGPSNSETSPGSVWCTYLAQRAQPGRPLSSSGSALLSCCAHPPPSCRSLARTNLWAAAEESRYGPINYSDAD
jgi:hypothetical protein